MTGRTVVVATFFLVTSFALHGASPGGGSAPDPEANQPDVGASESTFDFGGEFPELQGMPGHEVLAESGWIEQEDDVLAVAALAGRFHEALEMRCGSALADYAAFVEQGEYLTAMSLESGLACDPAGPWDAEEWQWSLAEIWSSHNATIEQLAGRLADLQPRSLADAELIALGGWLIGRSHVLAESAQLAMDHMGPEASNGVYVRQLATAALRSEEFIHLLEQEIGDGGPACNVMPAYTEEEFSSLLDSGRGVTTPEGVGSHEAYLDLLERRYQFAALHDIPEWRWSLEEFARQEVAFYGLVRERHVVPSEAQAAAIAWSERADGRSLLGDIIRGGNFGALLYPEAPFVKEWDAPWESDRGITLGLRALAAARTPSLIGPDSCIPVPDA